MIKVEVFINRDGDIVDIREYLNGELAKAPEGKGCSFNKDTKDFVLPLHPTKDLHISMKDRLNDKKT